MQPAGAVRRFDVAQDTAGADRRQLAVVPDEAHAAAADHHLGDRPVEAEGVGHAGLVDDDQAVRADAGHPGGRRLLRMVETPGELGEGVAGHVQLIGQGLRGGRGRRQSDHRSTGLGPCRAEDAHGGGLAGAGRGDGELDALSRARHVADEVALARRQLRPVGEGFEQGEVDEAGVDDASVGASGVGDDALFGVEDAAGGVPVHAGDCVDALAVRPPQGVGLLDRVVDAEPDRAGLQGEVDDGVDDAFEQFGGDAGGAGLPQSLGADVPALPGRALALQDADHAGGGVDQPVDARRLRLDGRPVEDGGQHAVHSPGAENLLSLPAPGGTLLGEGARLVLGLAGLEVGALGERDHLGLGGWASVIGEEGGGEFVAAVFDLSASGGPAGGEGQVDAVDLADGALAGGGAALDEADAEGLGERGLKGGGVELGRGDFGLVDQVGVEGVPASVGALHLVGDDEVGVEVGVAGAGVAVGEGDRDQAAGLDVADAVRADPAERLGLEVLDDLGDGLAVQLLELLAGGERGECPQCRERLRRRHGEVDAGDGGRDGTRPDRDRAVEFERGLGSPAELPGEELRRHLAADLGELVRVELRVGRESGGDVDGGVAALEFLPELR